MVAGAAVVSAPRMGQASGSGEWYRRSLRLRARDGWAPVVAARGASSGPRSRSAADMGHEALRRSHSIVARPSTFPKFTIPLFVVAVMITKDFPFAKDLHQIGCKSFVIMFDSPGRDAAVSRVLVFMVINPTRRLDCRFLL